MKKTRKQLEEEVNEYKMVVFFSFVLVAISIVWLISSSMEFSKYRSELIQCQEDLKQSFFDIRGHYSLEYVCYHKNVDTPEFVTMNFSSYRSYINFKENFNLATGLQNCEVIK